MHGVVYIEKRFFSNYHFRMVKHASKKRRRVHHSAMTPTSHTAHPGVHYFLSNTTGAAPVKCRHALETHSPDLIVAGSSGLEDGLVTLTLVAGAGRQQGRAEEVARACPAHRYEEQTVYLRRARRLLLPFPFLYIVHACMFIDRYR